MRNNILQVVKACAAAIIFALLFVLIFTLLLKFLPIPAAAIKPVNQVIKTLSVALGGLIFISGDKGLIKGAIYGILAVALMYLVFGAIAHSLGVSWKVLLELLLGGATGAIAGIIAVNVKKHA